MKPILNTQEVSDLLCCEPSTTRELARTGRLSGVKIGHDWVFPLTLLVDSITKMSSEPRPVKPGRGGAPAVPAFVLMPKVPPKYGECRNSRSRPRPELEGFNLADYPVPETV